MSIAEKGSHCWRPFLAWPSPATWLSSPDHRELRVETALCNASLFPVLDYSLLLENLPPLDSRNHSPPQSSSFTSWPLTLGLPYDSPSSPTLCALQTAAQLFSVCWGLDFPHHSFSLPTTTWAVPTFRTLYLVCAGSAFLPELLVAGSFSSPSSRLKCPSSANLLWVSCVIRLCPHSEGVGIFIYLLVVCPLILV